MTEFEERVIAVLRRLEPGEVVTYGEVAVEAGYDPGASRGVGNVLSRSEGLPWWRVVNASGRLVPGHEQEHARRLCAEGVAVEGDRLRNPRRRGRPGAMTDSSVTGASLPDPPLDDPDDATGADIPAPPTEPDIDKIEGEAPYEA